MFKRIILLVMLSSCYLASYAQQNAPIDLVVEFDAFTGLLKSELPYDVSFNMKIKISKTLKIKKVSFRKSRIKFSELKYFIKLRSQQFKEDRNRDKTINFYYEPIKEDDKHHYLVLNMNPLAPNTSYDISILEMFTGEAMETLHKLNSYIKNNSNTVFKEFIEKEKGILSSTTIAEPIDSTIRNQKLRTFYSGIIKSTSVNNRFYKDKAFKKIFDQYIKVIKQKSNATLDNNFNYIGEAPYNLSTYKAIYDDKLKEDYEALDAIFYIKKSMIEELINTPTLVNFLKLFKNGKEFNNEPKEYLLSSKLIANLKSFSNEKIIQILKGRGSIVGNANDELVSEYDLDARLLYTQTNKKAFNTLIEDIKSVRLFIGLVKDIGSEFDVEISKFLTDILPLIENMDAIIKSIDKIVKSNLDLQRNTKEELLFANTFMSTISSESSKLIIPDFGLVLGIDENNNFLRPFLGANINFGPVNKDIRTKYLSKELPPGSNKYFRYFRQHFSLMIGVSIGTIKVENKREDLFDGVNLMTGLSYRPTRLTRFSSGVLWYNSVDPNPTVSEKRLAGLWYWSLSFDIELKKQTGSTLNKFF
ncbi:hypothetical protein [Polaribacter sp. Hel1_85]|uniref:hypothetical protein n=1 Tax=Polaribacter sp. Hel1_85 TaxID=1250005 RepID=UPI00052E3733|nr:hypothetical protein [Polaribacter sp. Hel1_85]KGL63182.1 hypothetical protein PHEL85_0215 [Polaribacter sp. Hel1_85]